MHIPNLSNAVNIKWLLLGLLATVLAACGGGGGGESRSDEVDSDVGEGTATISGTITVASNSIVDSDTNDSEQDQTPNNSRLTAQPLPNPVSAGGYVSFGRDGTNEANGCFNNGGSDPIDWFQMELFADQVIELIIADKNTGDLDLLLVNGNNQIVAGSISPNSNESLTVPEDGEFAVIVCAYSNSSNYTLSVGQSQGGFTMATSSHSSTYQLSSAIIPGDIIIAWDNSSIHQTKPSLLAPMVAGAPVALQQKSAGGLGISLMQLDDASLQNMTLKHMSRQSSPQSQLQANSKAKPITFSTPNQLNGLVFVNSMLAERYATLEAIKVVQKQADVRYAEPNFLRQPLRVPNDRGYEFQWHYPLIDLPEAWDTTVGDPSVIVAVIDTGVLLNHPDLESQFDPNDPNGYDFISDRDNAGDGNGRDGNANDVGDDPGRGSSFHGTHVAGTIAAATNNGVGVAGVAWNARIMPLRALGRFGGSSFDIQQAVLYAAGLPNASRTTPAQPADVINLSLGGPGGSQSEQDAYSAARNRGVIIIAAAGNEATSQPSFPAAYEGVVSVSAVDQEKRLARYSNFGSTIDVAAPGGNTARDVDGDGYADGVLSTGGNDTSGNVDFVYPFFQGTSMAAPHVAGVAALMKSINADLTPAQFDQMLANGDLTEDIGQAGRDNQFGFGLINARMAVAAAVGGVPAVPPNTIDVNPRSLGFGVFLDELELDVSGNGDLAMTALPTDDATWLTVTPQNTEAGTNLGKYLATVDRTGLADGAYEAEITFTGNNNTVVVPVIMQVGDAFASDLGVHYVLLFKNDTNELVAQDVVQVDDGEYEYEFINVPAGEYRIIAGSDYDEDFVICDRGEACGAFITLDDPVVFEVGDADMRGMDFTSGYEASFNATRFNDDSNQASSDGLGYLRPLN